MCSHYKLTSCKGVCRQEEDIVAYNRRVTSAIKYIHDSTQNLVLKEKGRHGDEEAFVLVKNGIYQGYGFIDKHEQIINPLDLETFLIPQKETMEVQGILRKLLVQAVSLETTMEVTEDL